MGPSDEAPDLGPHDAEGSPRQSVGQLADELGVSVRYVGRVIAERRIPCVKVGHPIRFQRDEVERWVEANRVNAFTGRG